MEVEVAEISEAKVKKTKKQALWNKIKNQKVMIFMSLPFVIWVIIFKYLPLAGWVMAFEDYKPGKGLFDQTFVGLKHFKTLFKEPQFYQSLQNTLAMSILGLVELWFLKYCFKMF